MFNKGAVVMAVTESCRSSRGSRDECRKAPDGGWPLDHADGLEPQSRL